MLWLVLASVLVLCLCVYLWAAYLRGRVDWAKYGVPEIPGNVIKGSCEFLFKGNPAYWFIRTQHQYSGNDLVGIKLPLFQSALLVCSPEAVAEALKPGLCKERFLSCGSYDGPGSLNIFCVKDPLWTILRRQVSPMLTPSRVRAAAATVRDRAKRLTQRIDMELERKRGYNLRKILADFTTDIISVELFGVESNSLMEGKSIVRDATDAFMEYDFYRGLSWSSIFFCPKFLNIMRLPMFPQNGVKLIELALKSGAKTFNTEKEAKKARAINEMILSIKLPEEYKNIEYDAIVAQAVVLVQGGFETTASAIAFCLLELAYNQEAQERLYQELREAKERVGGDLDSATLSELPYLSAVIKEGLRLYPPMGWIDRVTSQPTEIRGVPVPAGTPLLLNMLGIQRDPRYFPDPEQFIPERFLPENEHNIRPFSWLPFGEGAKGCVGRRFGEQTEQFALSEMILNYTILPGSSPHPKDFTWEKRAMFLLPGEPLQLEIVPRSYS